MMISRNAVILAAGFSSRFAPLSYETPKGLLEVKGEILIERQIRQLKEAGIEDITVIVGYKAELFSYLQEKFNVKIILNDEYHIKNNLSSLMKAKDILGDTFICSADNYFSENAFLEYTDYGYYSAVYQSGETDEWCIGTDEEGYIKEVTIGGQDAFVMIGHAYFNREFSEQLIPLMEEAYQREDSSGMLWEHLYIKHLDQLKLKIKKYDERVIKEFDSLEELQAFDETYLFDTRSEIMSKISQELNCAQSEISSILPLSSMGQVEGFRFSVCGQSYRYDYITGEIRRECYE
ncbi:NTP transferase domain-containing protein [Proteiniclasticum ruminis]|uniref:CTP:phosphocholine cytidylyltransferase n=1 Tax=Proteiniclasticum ruminis TaxID=398199 RepID=A0A1I5A518_9CLOT|nr:NTP transferase domain-containing protein [Proteiniclasticum ruminis]SFN57517.1 CTP:phosphocholine cytidylyltransferase [Proteiniclasticum ruminis]